MTWFSRSMKVVLSSEIVLKFQGVVEKVEDLDLYVVGTGNKCIIWNYDIFGFDSGRTRYLTSLSVPFWTWVKQRIPKIIICIPDRRLICLLKLAILSSFLTSIVEHGKIQLHQMLSSFSRYSIKRHFGINLVSLVINAWV